MGVFQGSPRNKGGGEKARAGQGKKPPVSNRKGVSRREDKKCWGNWGKRKGAVGVQL